MDLECLLEKWERDLYYGSHLAYCGVITVGDDEIIQGEIAYISKWGKYCWSYEGTELLLASTLQELFERSDDELWIEDWALVAASVPQERLQLF